MKLWSLLVLVGCSAALHAETIDDEAIELALEQLAKNLPRQRQFSGADFDLADPSNGDVYYDTEDVSPARAQSIFEADRSPELLQHNGPFGHILMSGGAGEGSQRLSPAGLFENTHEVKTDARLPAYCDPPNPCPKGLTGADECIETMPNTAAFSRKYQSDQKCMCDPEHMFSCPSDSQSGMSAAEFQRQDLSSLFNEILDRNMFHESLTAKKTPAQLSADGLKQLLQRSLNENPYQAVGAGSQLLSQALF